MRSNQKKNKETTNIIFKHLLRHLSVGFRRIIHREYIIGNKSVGMETKRRSQVHTLEQVHLLFLSIVEPSSFEEAKNDEHWIKEMEEELSQIEKNETWEPIPRPKDINMIDTK